MLVDFSSAIRFAAAEELFVLEDAVFFVGAFLAAIFKSPNLVSKKTITQSKSPPPFPTGGFAKLSSVLLGVGANRRSRLDTTESFLTENAVTNEVLPTNRAETLKDVGHCAVHN